METAVNTVLGPIPSSRLGVTLMHEHLKVAWLGFEMDPFNTYNRKDAMRRAIENLKEVREFGVSTIVDPLPMGLGRDPEFHAEASRASGVNIIISTGLDADERSMPPYFRVRTTEEIAAVYVHDLTKGIGGTGIKAGVIKAATGEGKITRNETRALKAAARAAIATGVPIVTHTTRGALGVEQAQLFMGEGLSPAKIMIGHCCVSTDLLYLRRILDTGCSIGFDQIGLKHAQSDDSRLRMLMDLLALGRVRQVCLSQDHVCCIVGAPYERIPHFVEQMKDVRYSHLFRSFLPRLRQAGVSEETIRLMLVENPRRLFEAPARAAPASVKEKPRAKAA